MKQFFSKHVIAFGFLIFVVFNGLQGQVEMQIMGGKAHGDRRQQPALRYGIGLNNLIFQRVGLYYTYEFRRPSMPFETTTFTKNYTRDLLGFSYQINPHFTTYGGVGAFHDGLLDRLTTAGLRKEIGIQWSTNNFLQNSSVFV